jgi:hypothetical protein
LNISAFDFNPKGKGGIPTARVLASEATRKRIKGMTASGAVEQSAVIREAVRLIIEETLEAEVKNHISGSGFRLFHPGVCPSFRDHHSHPIPFAQLRSGS